jgi:16S rRNA (adenine1518-N6/adenine1519-N6)-dimethyltransferase
LTPALPHARKRFGQHFLEPSWAARLIDAIGPDATDTFLEIGPGRGALTLPLAARAGHVIAVEIDRDLAMALQGSVSSAVRIVQDDVLTVDLRALLVGARVPIRVVGNLPYNIASPILFRLLDAADDGRLIRDATVMLQREVAERLLAPPATSAYGALTIQVTLRADIERVLSLPPGAFRPAPKVHSSVVRLTFRPPKVEVGDFRIFERVTRGVFLQRRKTVGNALKPVAHALGQTAEEMLRRAGLDPRRRPQTLTVDDIARLTRAVL